MWGGGYAGLLRNPSGKWCGIIGLGVIQIKKQGLLRSPAGASSLATNSLSQKFAVTKAPQRKELCLSVRSGGLVEHRRSLFVEG